LFPILLILLSGGIYQREIGKTAFKGWIFGLIAVFIYDLSRIPFMYFGWGDFIPRIGGWLTGTDHPDALIGYTWRYVGNGGGMGMSFLVLFSMFRVRYSIILKGILYGMFIYGCLISTLIIFPEAQEMMFKLTPLSIAGSFTGHVVYGTVLGALYKYNRIR
jgi:hypothetical protein